ISENFYSDLTANPVGSADTCNPYVFIPSYVSQRNLYSIIHHNFWPNLLYPPVKVTNINCTVDNSESVDGTIRPPSTIRADMLDIYLALCQCGYWERFHR